jgi:hypothetical protein
LADGRCNSVVRLSVRSGWAAGWVYVAAAALLSRLCVVFTQWWAPDAVASGAAAASQFHELAERSARQLGDDDYYTKWFRRRLAHWRAAARTGKSPRGRSHNPATRETHA